jgi:hypothetical protein
VTGNVGDALDVGMTQDEAKFALQWLRAERERQAAEAAKAPSADGMTPRP